MKITSFLKKYIPKWAAVALVIFLISCVLYAFSVFFPTVADLLNETLGTAARFSLSLITVWLPFSLFELLIILLLPLFVTLVILLVKKGKTHVRRVRCAVSLLAAVSLILTSYIFTLGIGYRTTPIGERLNIESPEHISPEELYSVARRLRDEVNSLSSEIRYEGGVSVMPYSVRELSDKLCSSFDKLNEEYPFIKSFDSRVKPVLFSTVMSDAGITGIYSFFTGEANVNVEYPQYNLPYVAAHEMSHQRGVSRENEANFIAFLVCIGSTDPFIRYSGYLSMYEYIASWLYRADEELYFELAAGLDESAVDDIRASRAVTAEHSDSLLGKLNDKANDAYLKLNGTEGVVSYGYVVRLAVGYYRGR